MKFLYSILVILLILSSCKKKDEYLYDDMPLTADISLWDHLQEDASHSYFVELIKQYKLDTLLVTDNIYTLFIPGDDELRDLNPDSVDIADVLAYQIIPTYINLQNFDESLRVRTQLEKFALLEYSYSTGSFTLDGVEITEGSSIFNNGRIYYLADCVKPSSNIYEYLVSNSTVFSNYIDLQDSTYFDAAESTPIGFTEQGTVYDSVFTTVNRFYRDFFACEEEQRNKSATFVTFTQQQFENALDIVKADLETDIIPEVWKNEILLPNLISSSVFNNSLQFTEFEPRMVNIQGDSVDVNVGNIDQGSRTVCSNGIVYSLSDFIIPDSLYKSQNVYNGQDAVFEIISGQKWAWEDDVTVEGLEGTDIEPALGVLSTSAGEIISLNDEVLSLSLKEYEGDPGQLRISFVQKGLFAAKNYRLVWAGSSNQCGLWKIYVNGEPIQMRDYRGKSVDYFDSYQFNESVIRSVTGAGNFRSNNGYCSVDFKVETITEYTDAVVTFEYVGPSVDSWGEVRGNPGLIIDYIMFEIY